MSDRIHIFATTGAALGITPDCDRVANSSTSLPELYIAPDSASATSSNSSSSFVFVAGAVYNALKRKRKRSRRISFVHRLLPFWYHVTFDDITSALGQKLFQKSYRMSQQCFQQLLGDVRDLIEKPFKAATEYRRSTVPLEVRLGITLRMLSGGSYLDLFLAYQVAEDTIRDIFHDTCDALMSRLHLKGFPKTQAGLKKIAWRFQTSRKDLSPLSGCVGALDGICIKIEKPEPQENPAMFWSRKGFYAIPVQALVDSDYIFRFCSAICTGSTHDSHAHSVSGLRRELERGSLGAVFYIVGDEAYICSEHLITPIPKSLADSDEDNFNFFLSSLRMHVEQAFGMLVARWRILRGGLDFSVKTSTNLICLLMKLHNYVIENDKERSVLRYELTDHDKEALEADVNEGVNVARGGAREFQDRDESQRCEHVGALPPVSGSSDTRKRDLLVRVVKQKGRTRPDVPLQPYNVDLDSHVV